MDLLTIVLLLLLIVTSSLDVILFIWIRYYYKPDEQKEAVEAVKGLLRKVDKKNNLAQQDAELIDSIQSIDKIRKLVN